MSTIMTEELLSLIAEYDRIGDRYSIALKACIAKYEGALRTNLAEQAAARQDHALLRQHAQDLVDLLDEAKPHIDSAIVMSRIHGVPYGGPDIEPALVALRAALNTSTPA